MLNTSNIKSIETFLNNSQIERKKEVSRAQSSGGTRLLKRNSKGLNTKYSRRLRHSLKKNPKLAKSLKRLIKCKSKRTEH